MFFIYPASISENCDKKIAAAACKCIERFFLIQIQDAFQHNILKCKQVYIPRKKQYSDIMLESKRVTQQDNVLIESDNTIYDFIERNTIDKFDSDSDIRRKLRNLQEMKRRLDPDRHYNQLSLINEIENKSNPKDDKDDKNKSNPKDDKDDKNKKSKDDKKRSRNSYEPILGKIDIIPTAAVINVPILQVNGEGSDKKEVDRELTIGVKVIPSIMRNFKEVETSILDDYFSRVSESAFKMFTRKLTSVMHNSFTKLINKIPGIRYVLDAKVNNDEDDARDSVYKSERFINASAFRSNRNSPSNYKFASNIIMFNKDDLTDTEDYNLFQNRSAMNRLFNMGWSTFAVLDPIEEEMTFISSLDGGYMHIIPYQYMFETIGSKSLYDSAGKLKNSSSPFNIRRGNFAAFARSFND